MAETTYILGAGISRSIQVPDGFRPPLARDFFRQALRHPRISSEDTIRQIAPLLDFIEKYWHLSRSEMRDADFDLEECFTFLELQRRDAARSQDQNVLLHTSKLQWLLTQLLLDYMSECQRWFLGAAQLQAFVQHLLRERAAIITFNYDTLLESTLEAASPPRQDAMTTIASRDWEEDLIRDDDIAYSPREWNPYLAYKVQFDEVALRLPGNLRMVEGARYYGHVRNQTDTPPFLKLHGSLGWFFRSGYRVDGVPLEGETASRVGRSVLRRGLQRLGVPELDYTDGEILLPLIITPVLNKPYDQHQVLQTVWAQARSELSETRKLVIGGYSFPLPISMSGASSEKYSA